MKRNPGPRPRTVNLVRTIKLVRSIRQPSKTKLVEEDSALMFLGRSWGLAWPSRAAPSRSWSTSAPTS